MLARALRASDSPRRCYGSSLGTTGPIASTVPTVGFPMDSNAKKTVGACKSTRSAIDDSSPDSNAEKTIYWIGKKRHSDRLPA